MGPWRGTCFSLSKRLVCGDTDFAKLCMVLKERKAAETQASLFAHSGWCVWPSGHACPRRRIRHLLLVNKRQLCAKIIKGGAGRRKSCSYHVIENTDKGCVQLSM